MLVCMHVQTLLNSVAKPFHGDSATMPWLLQVGFRAAV